MWFNFSTVFSFNFPKAYEIDQNIIGLFEVTKQCPM